MSSGAILVRLTLKAAPTLTGSGPFVAQTFGLSTGDTDQTGIDIVGDGATCKFWSGYISGLTWSDSLDLSQGKGGFASASDGALTLIDATANTGVSLSAAIRSGLVVIEGATVWVAALPPGGTFTDVLPIRQFQVVGDCSVGGGDDPTVTINLRTASWAASDAMEATINKTQITTSADDSQNPTDPNYPDGAGDGQLFQTSVGRAFGGIAVSIKAGRLQPTQKIARFGATLLVRGELSADPSTLGFGRGVSLTADSIGRIERPSAFGAALLFKCKTTTQSNYPTPDLDEANRIVALLDRFVAEGYEIVLSNGIWFLSGNSFDRFDGFSYVDSTFSTVDTNGEFYGTHSTSAPFSGVGYSGVWFNVTDSDRMPMFPAGLDPTSVSIYAVPKSVLVCAEQVAVDGIAVNGATLTVSIDRSDFNGEYTAFSPRQASSDAVIASAPVLSSGGDESLLSVDPTGASAGQGCAIVDFPSGSGHVSGDTSAVSVNGGAWSGDDADAILARIVLGLNATAESSLRVNFKIDAPSFDADFFCTECHYSMKATSDLFSVVNVSFTFQPPFFAEPDQHRTLSALLPEMDVDRTKDSGAINWRSFFASIDEVNEKSFMELVNTAISQPDFLGINIKIKRIVLKGFKKIGFSSVYPVVYPFFRRYGFEQIAASPTAVCGVDGLESIAVGAITGQNIAWSTSAPAVASDTGSVRLTGVAYDGASRFLAVGYMANAATADDRMVFATSTDGGATWATSKDATFPGYAGGKVYCDGARWVILVAGDNYIRTQTVAGYPGAWTDAVASRQFNAAKGNGSLWLVGGAVASDYNLATTTDFASLATQTVGTTEEVRAISWIPSSKTWLVGMTDGSVWYSTVATDATVPTSWTKVVVFAGNLTALGNWSGTSVEAFGFDADGRIQQFGSADGVNWTERDSRPDVATYNAVYTNPSGTGIWIGASGSNQVAQVITSDSAAINWTPWATPSPSTALQNLRSTRMGGVGAHDYNPIHWSGLRWSGSGMGGFGISFDPGSGETPSTAIAKICGEWWGFAGEFAGDVDASNDPIPEELPRVEPGDIEDVYSELTFEYHKFGDAYLKTAYVRNVDTAYVTGNDSFYFGGWDPVGTNTNGLAIWNECRASYLRYGTKRELKRSFDSVHDEIVMGNLWTYAHPDLGMRIRHITRQPRYLYLTVQGIFGSAQAIASHRAASGCRYKPNQTMIAAQGWALPEWGIVTSVQPDPISGNIELEIMFAPE